MKRCPQCEFIYEDDQSLCDMDGALLVFDARTLPNLHALAPIDVPVAPKAAWRHRTFPAMAALILATVLSLVYFVSTQRSAPVSAALPTLPNVQSSGASTVAPASNIAPAPEVNSVSVTAKEDTKPEAPKINTPATPAAKKAVAKAPTERTERKPEEPKKDDSKVGSILKKTGRLLKKPFKL